MTPKIRTARTRLIWFDRDARRLEGGCVDGGSTIPDFADEAVFSSVFGAIGSADFKPPWAHSGRLTERMPAGRFWRRYLGVRSGVEVSPRQARRRFVPLRMPSLSPAATSHASPGIRLRLEAMLYAHGTGVIATIYLDEPTAHLTLENVADAIGRAREGSWEMLWPDDLASARAKRWTIDAAVLEIIRRSLRARCPGSEDRLPIVKDPFTVSAPIRGDTDSAFDAEAFSTSLDYAAVWAWAEASTSWRRYDPPDFSGAGIPSRRNDGIVLATERKRVLWFPGSLGDGPDDQKPRTALSCYSRNLTMLALQIEALGALVRWGEERLRLGPLTNAQERLVKEAINRIAALYGRDVASQELDSYLSLSGRRHIDALGLVSACRDVCQRLGREVPTSLRPPTP